MADDWIKISQERNLGLSKAAKSIGLLTVAIGFAVLAVTATDVHTNLSFTRFDNFEGLDMGPVLWCAWAVLLIVGCTNAVNLTDGLDGLAGGSAIFGFAAFTVIAFWAFRNAGQAGVVANYQIPDALDLAAVAAALVGSTTGFLWWNATPARIFMGDTGSLAIGGGLAGLALLLSTSLLLPIIGGLFVFETVSVIVQVAGFRLFGKRPVPHGADPPPLRAGGLAPDHHHRPLLDPGRAVDGHRPRPLPRRLHPPHRPVTAPLADPVRADRPTVVMGLGVTGRAVARALVRRGFPVRLADDAPGPADRALAADLGLEVVEAPDRAGLAALLEGAGALVPAPGLPERHPAVALAAEAGLPAGGRARPGCGVGPPARAWPSPGPTARPPSPPWCATCSWPPACRRSTPATPRCPWSRPSTTTDRRCSWWRPRRSAWPPCRRFAPIAGCWLNFGPDHQDVHRDLAGYEAAKANIWRGFGPDQLAVANRDDPVVAGHAAGLPPRRDLRVRPGPRRHRSPLVGRRLDPAARPRATPWSRCPSWPGPCPTTCSTPRPRRPRRAPPAPAPAGMAAALRAFRHLPHRVQLVGEGDGIAWYDDSKATAPHATLAALSGLLLGRAAGRGPQQGPRPLGAGRGGGADPGRRRHG